MPLYDFKCVDCGHEFEARLPVDERGETYCQRCGDGMAMKKFTLATYFHVPTHFRYTSGWQNPPKGDARWAEMEKDQETLGQRTDTKREVREEFKKAGLL
ncbi:MAG: zinc ribbon domain-containing protein [Gemmatimonadales bacterium]|nr:zinc ribbon domain-containing protein [Gemmatimonadales bacterium]